MLDAEHILSSFMNYSYAGIAILEGPDLRYVNINQFLADLNGYPIKYHIGKTLLDVMPDAKKNLIPVMRKIMNDGKAVLGREFNIILPNNPKKLVHLKDFLFPITDNHDKPIGIGAIVLDISKKMETERKVKMRTRAYIEEIEGHKITFNKLEKQKIYFENLFQASPDAILISDGSDTIINANRSFEKTFGYTKDEIIGDKVNNLIVPHGLKGESKKYTKEVAGGKTVSFESIRRTKRGDIIDVSVVASPFSWDTNHLTVYSIYRDISSRKRVENELKESQRQLRNFSMRIQLAREEERTEVAHEIHDELGQALTALKLDIASLMKDLPDELAMYSNRAKSIIELVDITTDTVRRIATELRPGVLDVLGLIAAIEWQSEEFQEKTGIKCIVKKELEEVDLGKDASTAVFRILQEAFTNITRHSKATKVIVRLKQNKDKFELEISDNGIGITDEKKNDPVSFGLIAMRERLYPWRGELTIEGIESKGTTLCVKVPNNE